MDSRNFFAELKRRNVYRVAVAYAVVAWLLIQIATQLFPFFEIPNWAVRLVVLLLALGFPELYDRNLTDILIPVRGTYFRIKGLAGVAVEFMRSPAGQFDRMAIYSPGSENVIAPRKK